MSYPQRNQYYYEPNNRPQPPVPPHQPHQGPARASGGAVPADIGRDPRSAYNFAQYSHPQYQSQHAGYNQQTSPPSAYPQSQIHMQPQHPPYPTYSHEYPPAPPILPQTQYQPRQSPPQPSYNPQHYAQAPSSSYNYPNPISQSYAPAPPPRPHQYNPAAYHPSNYQENAIAAAASRTYAPTMTSHAYPDQTSSWNPNSSPQYYVPEVSPSAQYSSQHPASRSQTYQAPAQGGSTPLSSRPLPQSPVPEHYRDSASSYSDSTETLPEYSSPPLPTGVSPSGSLSQNAQRNASLTPGLADMPAQFQNQSGPTYRPARQSSTSPSRALDRNDRHPQSRPLPGPPLLEPDSVPTYTAPSEHEHYQHYSEDVDQDQLFEELEIAWRGPDALPPDLGQHRTAAPDDPASASNHYIDQREWQDSQTTNGDQWAHQQDAAFTDSSNDSDEAAEMGLKAMALAAEEEALERRRRESGRSINASNGSRPQSHRVQSNEESLSDDESSGMVDLSSIDGGTWQPSVYYGGPPNELITSLPDHSGATLQAQHHSTSSKGSIQRSEGYPVRSSSDTSLTDYSYSFQPNAQVDQAGTGGNIDPSRKLSFEESSENISFEEQASAGADMAGGPPDLPYSSSLSMNTSVSTKRPLPFTPDQDLNVPMELRTRGPSPQQPEDAPYAHAYQSLINPTSLNVRSSSSFSHPTTPRPIEPTRAKTDGKRQNLRLSTVNTDIPVDVTGLQTPAHVGIDIPTLPPGRRFHPSKLSDKDFERCQEPWALSAISSWLQDLAEGEAELRENAIVEALVALFTNKIPNMNITIAEGLAADVVSVMVQAAFLVHEEEWLRFGRGAITGVLYQLTGNGCYSSYLHLDETAGRCYSPHCLQMAKKVSLQAHRSSQSVDWATFYNLSRKTLEESDKKAIEFQNNLHEIVSSEDTYMDQLQVLSTLYRDGLCSANPAIIAPQVLNSFLRDVFGKLDAVKQANEEHLLPQLRYRQQEQGPWIVGFSDIFRHWIRKAKTAYIEYAANFPHANAVMKREESRNTMFKAFLESARNNKMSNRLEWSSFLRAPITRLQRYSLLLATAQKHMPPENVTECSNLQLALEEIRAVTMECDARVAESGKKADLHELQSKFHLRPEMKGVELNLHQYGRKIIFRGDLLRLGSNRFHPTAAHAILLDNYLILAKIMVSGRDVSSDPEYDISKAPIPMDLLILESSNDDPVEKSYKGLSSVAGASNETRPTKSGSISIPSGLTHATTHSSVSTTDSTSSGKTMVTTTVLSDGSAEGRVLYPFRIKHLGRETFTLYANSAEIRRTWCEKIVRAKEDHASSLYAQNAEPFKLRVIADSAFAYDTYAGGQKAILTKGSPLSRAVLEVEKMYDHKGRPGPICRARVNCATTFVQPHGQQMLAIGTDYGVYISERGNPRGWSRAIPVLKVTQISVLEDFNLFLLISDKSLIAYHLDVICPPSGAAANNDSVRKAPQKLSGSRDVGFFATGKMKDRTLVFYKKGTMSSTFKILEPILQRAPEKKVRSILSRSNTDFFREYDDFYIPADCTSLDVFNSTLSIATSKGLEVLNLDKKTPWSVPDLKAPHVATIASRLSGVNPLAMFRLDELEFLCVYEECAVYVNKHGDVSRSVVMEFVGKAKAAALEGGYLILFDQDFVEIRNAQAGSLKQVIAGRDIRCLDTGRGATASHGTGPRSIKFALQHPEYERTQIVVELVLGESRRIY